LGKSSRFSSALLLDTANGCSLFFFILYINALPKMLSLILHTYPTDIAIYGDQD
ncbi:MAG: hypothetical protein HLUCCA11_22735, partial [Phormidesmis priestleyi Ana]